MEGILIKTLHDFDKMGWSPDGRVVTTAHQDGPVRLWYVESGTLQVELAGHRGWARGVGWSPEGERLATTGSDGRVVVWDVQTGERIAEF